MNAILMNVLLGSVPLGILFGAIRFWTWQRSRLGKRVPVSSKLLRAPGETLRRNLRDLEWRLFEQFAWFAFFSGCFAFALKDWNTGPVRVKAIGTILPVLLFTPIPWLVVRMVRILKEHRNYQLGLSGERLVGEQLNGLVRDGCHVFHDFPANGIGNIDHIVVGPTGVFAIETKSRRKGGKVLPGRKDYQVGFDGRVLHFPQGPDTQKLQQAQRSADWLNDYLSNATGEPVKVAPLLILPGWFIDRVVKGGIAVLNEKEVRRYILDFPGAQHSEQTIRRILHQLDQKCRDVEF